MLAHLIESTHSLQQAFTSAFKSSYDTNSYPVIGVVSQPLPYSLVDDPRFEGKTSYIMQAYVDFMKDSGARVIPIILEDSNEVVDEKLSKVNGVLFPGGAGDYKEIGDYIYKSLIKENDEGHFFPLWGTCLGFENLGIFASDSGNPLSNLVSHSSLTLEFLESDPASNTKMFKGLANAEYFSDEAMTYNSHSYGIAWETFTTDAGLGSMFTPTSLSTDGESGDTFVATMESPNYPFFGTQFHPEKVLTMYNSDEADHSWESVQFNRFFSDRFMEEARQNSNTCGDFTACQAIIIDNYPIYVTDSYYGNIYAF